MLRSDPAVCLGLRLGGEAHGILLCGVLEVITGD